MFRKSYLNHMRLVVAALLFALAPSLAAQSSSTGALTGTVTDPSGAAIPNVTVTATSASGQSRSEMTGPDGVYHLTLLPPGSYSVKFEATGFNAAQIPSVAVNVTETAVLNQSLGVGSQTQEVTVQAEAEAIQTSNATTGDVVGSVAAVGLPLTTRNYTNLLGLSAGANAGVFNAATFGKGTTDIAVNGLNTVQNNVQMDGVSISVIASSGTIADGTSVPGIGVVNPDAVEEFKIQTSLFDAGYGRNPGASVNVITKSGTNDFHGSAFEFFRNTALNANDFFRNSSPPLANGSPNNSKLVLAQNQFGGVVGGPIKKDKLFFFASYQGTHQRNGAASQGFSQPLLLPILPGGDRSNTAALKAAVGASFCPTGPDGQNTTIGGTQVLCSGANINPVAIALLQAKNPDGTYLIPSAGLPYPTTSSKGATTGQSTTFSIPASFTENQGLGNLDYVINGKNTLSSRFFIATGSQGIPLNCATCLPGSAVSSVTYNTDAVLRLTTILSNHLVNQARISIQKNSANFGLANSLTADQFGITPNVASIRALPEVIVTNLFTLGTPLNDPQRKWPSDWGVADELSWTHGKHTFRYGIEFERDRFNWNLVGLATGILTFNTMQDFLLGLPGCATVDATCAASAAAGTTNGTAFSNISSSGQYASVVPPGGLWHAYRVNYGAGYVQDDIKLKPRFTLNLGLRWEYDALPYDTNGLSSDVWTSLINTVPVPGSTPATGTLAGFVVPSNWNAAQYPLTQGGVGGVYQNLHKGFQRNNTPLTDFAPRLGFAWSPLPNNRLAIRGGTGYFYDRVGFGNWDQGTTQGEPYATSDYQSGQANYFSSFQVPYAPPGLVWTPRWVNFAATTSSNISEPQVEENFRVPVVYEWNFFAQYEFLPNWTMEMGYVGSRGIHLYNNSTQINEAQIAGNLAGTGTHNTIVAPGIAAGLVTTNSKENASLRVPYLGFAPAGMQTAGNDADAKFGSFQATLRKRFSHGFQVQAAYTYSRSITTTIAGTGLSATFNDPNINTYMPSPSYRPNRMAINYLWNLPLGSHQGLLGKVTSGWGWSGVTIIQSGTPLTVTDSTGGTLFGFGPGNTVVSTAEYSATGSGANAASTGSTEQRLGGTHSTAGWFNSAAFTKFVNVPTTDGTGWGNAGLGIVRGPGQFNWDMSLTKTTTVGGLRENASLQFRAEFFNAFNHPQFSNPAVDFSKGNFGQITSTSVNPRLIQFALKYLF